MAQDTMASGVVSSIAALNLRLDQVLQEDVRERREQLTQWCWSELKKSPYAYWETD
ncbi:hypothetical protein PIB30_095626, partial [Stylosanthes scabra]|nr:hypothetical protein [Stylosanthes scabra]